MKENLLREQMEGMIEDYILEAIFKLRTENIEVHDRIIEYFTNQYDEYSQSSEVLYYSVMHFCIFCSVFEYSFEYVVFIHYI